MQPDNEQPLKDAIAVASLGDNRSGSAYSRAHLNDHGSTIPAASVIGVVTRIVSPLSRVRAFSTPSYGFS